MSDISSTTAASTASSPQPTELLNASVTKGDAKPLDPSLALGGNQSVNDAVEDNIQEGAPESIETQTASETKPPVPGEAQLSGTSSAVILDPVSDNRNFASLVVTSMIGGFSPFKENNGSPFIQRPQDEHAGQTTKGDKASMVAAAHTTKKEEPASSATNIYQEIEAADSLAQQTQNEQVKDDIASSSGTTAITEQAITANINALTVQAEQASQGSAGKNPGPVLTAIDNFFGISVSPSTSASQGSLTVSLTLPNGASRTTTITTVNNGTEVGSGSVGYTKNTTGGRGQTNDTAGTVTKTGTTTTTSGGASVSVGEITKQDTGTITTATGRTIDESGVSSRTEAVVDNNGNVTHLEDTRQAELYTTTGPKDHTIPRAGHENEGRNITNSQVVQMKADKDKAKLDPLETVALHHHQSPTSTVNQPDIINELPNIENAETLKADQEVEKATMFQNIQNIQNIISSMRSQDKNALALGLQAMTAAAI